MRLPDNAKPTVHQDAIPGIRVDGLGVLDDEPRESGPSLAIEELLALHLAEAVLLPVGGIPDPVEEEVADTEEDEWEHGPSVL